MSPQAVFDLIGLKKTGKTVWSHDLLCIRGAAVAKSVFVYAYFADIIEVSKVYIMCRHVPFDIMYLSLAMCVYTDNPS